MERTLTPEFEIEMTLLLEAVNLTYDYDFRHYSPKSLKRTLVHAMNRMECHTLSILQEKILHDATAFDDLLQSLTIPVSEMFRDPTYWIALRDKVFPLLTTYPSLKIWVAGCSAGEEIYSLAILLHEAALLERTILYATDINPKSLAKAAAGVFDVQDIPHFTQNYQKSNGQHALSDYYSASATSVQFHNALRKNVTFTDHSLVTDTVFSEMQLISCRNVLIYFDRELQNRVLGLFHESLCRKGFLGLGSQETTHFSPYAQSFVPFVKKNRIFQKRFHR